MFSKTQFFLAESAPCIIVFRYAALEYGVSVIAVLGHDQWL